MGSHENLNVNPASKCKTLWVMLSKFIFDLFVSSIMVYLTLCDTNPRTISFSLTHTNTHTHTYTHRQTITQKNEKRRSYFARG